MRITTHSDSPALNWIATMQNTAELFDTENIKSKTKSHELQQQSERVRAIISREQRAVGSGHSEKANSSDGSL